MGTGKPSQSTTNLQLKSSRIIIFAQSMGVIASISGLIGVTLAYRALKRNAGRTTMYEAPPTIE